jgi:hypothetical protein
MVTNLRGQLTNLQLLKPSRKKQRPGDLFAMRPRVNTYVFGRVIRTDALWSIIKEPFREPWDFINLAYIYNHTSETSGIPEDLSVLSPDNLLVPPQFLDRLWWSRGYFETITNIPLDEERDVLRQHCFQDGAPGKWVDGPRYYDEYNNRLPGPVEPVGELGLPNIGLIDRIVCDALGIPFPDELNES